MRLLLPVVGAGEYHVEPQKIICLGLNYAEHIKESAQADSERFKDEKPSQFSFPKLAIP